MRTPEEEQALNDSPEMQEKFQEFDRINEQRRRDGSAEPIDEMIEDAEDDIDMDEENYQNALRNGRTDEDWWRIKQDAIKNHYHPYRLAELLIEWPTPVELMSYPFFDSRGWAVVNVRLTPGDPDSLGEIPYGLLYRVVQGTDLIPLDYPDIHAFTALRLAQQAIDRLLSTDHEMTETYRRHMKDAETFLQLILHQKGVDHLDKAAQDLPELIDIIIRG